MESTDTFGKNVKGAATMGSKHKPEQNLNPGPGQYEDKINLKANPSNFKIGTTKRTDLWGVEGKNLESTPGPGHHTLSYSSFANVKGSTNFGCGRKEQKNFNPGPGHYDNASKQLMTKSASVRIGS